MEPLHVLALSVFVLLLSTAAAFELLGAWRLVAQLCNLLRRQPPNAPKS